MTPEVHTLTGPYVLDALPDDERTSFERHLADCPSCQAEVAELREAAARLGGAAAVDPPADLRSKVLDAVAETRQLPPGSAVPSRRITRRSWFALAAAAVSVAGTSGIAIDQYRGASRERRENAELTALLAERDARIVRDSVTGGGQVTVVTSARLDRAVVLLRDLPTVPDNRTYQLWLLDESRTAHSAGLARGGTHHHRINRGVAGKVAFGLTLEPTGGSSSPTCSLTGRRGGNLDQRSLDLLS